MSICILEHAGVAQLYCVLLHFQFECISFSLSRIRVSTTNTHELAFQFDSRNQCFIRQTYVHRSDGCVFVMYAHLLQLQERLLIFLHEEKQ